MKSRANRYLRHLRRGALMTTIVALASSSAIGGEVVLHNFAGGTDGAVPFGPLISDAFGYLYGVTTGGGAGSCDCGTIYTLGRHGDESVLYTFTGGNDGSYPDGRLILDQSGNLLGTAEQGGTNNAGTIFQVAPDGTETTLYSFAGTSDGSAPIGGLVADQQGDLFGVTFLGGNVNSECIDGCGTVFELSSSVDKTTLYMFQGGSDGWAPEGQLIIDAGGNLYGVTTGGGMNCEGSTVGCGTLFKIAPDGTESQLHVFQGGSDGAFPGAGLIMDQAGNLYGTTGGGGGGGGNNCAGGCGTVFKIASGGTESILHAFQAGTDGAGPDASLIMDNKGDLYGTTVNGGSGGKKGGSCGTAFELSSKGKENILHAFNCRHGEAPKAGLLMGKRGVLYGTTSEGGTSNDGVVFELKK